MTIEVLFFHGAGAGAFDADVKLADSLATHLGHDYRVSVPRLPEDDESDDRWLQLTAEAITKATPPLVLVGHSVGGYLLLKYLSATSVTSPIAAICVIAAPFPHGPDWPYDGFELPERFGERLPPGARVFLYASEDDETIPFSHRDHYAAAIPGAITRTTAGGHQLGDDLRAVADDILALGS